MKDIMKGDLIGYDLVSKYLISDFMTPVMKVITWFGSGFALIILTILSFLGIIIIITFSNDNIFTS